MSRDRTINSPSIRIRGLPLEGVDGKDLWPESRYLDRPSLDPYRVLQVSPPPGSCLVVRRWLQEKGVS